MTIQSDVYVIILVTIILSIGMILTGKSVARLDPYEKPKGFAGAVVLGVQSVYNSVKTNVGTDNANRLTPYILTLWAYVFLCNILSLFGLSSPTANFSVTLTLSFMTWCIIQKTEFKYDGVKAWFHSFLEPFAFMLPVNIVGKFSTMLSMAMRLFGNITCGSIMMQLVYAGLQAASNMIAGLFGGSGNVFNFMGVFIAPVLHCYFDLFAGFIQTLVFVTLTMVLIGNDIPEEAKK